MGKLIAMVSGKGGVGKTTITAELGIALSKAGFKVCLVDADVAMANLSLLLGMQSSPITLHDVLLGDAVIHDAIYDGPAGLSFVPSGLSLDSYRRVDSEKLSSVVRSLKNEYDYILLDAASGIGKDVMATLAATDESLLISMPTSPAIADLLKTKIVAQRLGNKPSGVIMNFMRNEKGEITATDVMKMMELPVYGSVPFDEEIRKSFLQEKVSPVMIRMPNTPAAVAVRKIVARLTGVTMAKEEKSMKLFGFLKSNEEKKPGLLARILGIFFKKKKQ
jgi:septum site-determining protein MinD